VDFTKRLDSIVCPDSSKASITFLFSLIEVGYVALFSVEELLDNRVGSCMRKARAGPSLHAKSRIRQSADVFFWTGTYS
jgi:hypothetical protein